MTAFQIFLLFRTWINAGRSAISGDAWRWFHLENHMYSKYLAVDFVTTRGKVPIVPTRQLI